MNASSEIRPVAAGTRCHSCGYDLRGLNQTDNCPECGRRVVLSLSRSLGDLGVVCLHWLALGLSAALGEYLVVVLVLLLGWLKALPWEPLVCGGLIAAGVLMTVQAWAFVLADPARLRWRSAMAATIGALVLMVIGLGSASFPFVWLGVPVLPLIALRHRASRRALELAAGTHVTSTADGMILLCDVNLKLELAGTVPLALGIFAVYLIVSVAGRTSDFLPIAGCCGLPLALLVGVVWLVVSFGFVAGALELLVHIRRVLPSAYRE